MKSPKFNTEQAEAKEINTLPRVVVTANELFVFPQPGKEVSFDLAQMKALGSVMRTLGASKRKKIGR